MNYKFDVLLRLLAIINILFILGGIIRRIIETTVSLFVSLVDPTIVRLFNLKWHAYTAFYIYILYIYVFTFFKQCKAVGYFLLMFPQAVVILKVYFSIQT